MNRDCGRADLYAAEAAAFDGTDLESLLPFADLAALIRAVVATPWWPGPPVRVVRARRDATSSSARLLDGAGAVIRISADQSTVATAAHELAHALAGPAAGHSAQFLRAYLDVVAVITNLDSRNRRHDLHVDQLGRALDAAGLAVGERSWPPPAEATGTAIAL